MHHWKKLIAVALGFGAAVAAVPAAAQEFPSKPITMVVPFPPGGNADTVARLVAESASQTLGQPMVVENRPGGHGMVAAAQVLGAEHDGHTIYLATDGQYAVNSNVMDESRDDPMDHFKPIIQLVNGPLVLAASPKLGIDSFEQFLAEARAGKVFSYGANDVRSAHYIISQILQDEAGIEMRHIPYGGTSAAMPDLLSGRIDLLIGQSTALATQQSQGVKLLAVTTEDGLDDFPDLPSVSEFVPGFDFSVAYGLFAPEGTPDSAVAVLNESFKKALSSAKVSEAILSSGAVPAPGTPDEFGAFVDKKRAAFKKVLANLDLDQ